MSGMGMSMGMSMSMSQRAELSMAQRLEARMELLHIMTADVQSLLDDSGFAPDETYDAMVDELVQRLAVMRLRQPNLEGEDDTAKQQRVSQEISIISHVLKKDLSLNLKEYGLKSPLNMADMQADAEGVPTMRLDRMREIVARRMYEHYQMGSGFSFPEDVTRTYRTIAPNLVDAINSPDKLRKNIEELMNLMRNAGAGVGATQEVSERQDALAIAEKIRPDLDYFVQVIGMALSVPSAEGEPMLRNFYRDLAILRRLLFVESSRLQKKFATDFKSVNARTKPADKELALLNLIGQYTLVSIGAVVPDVFIRQKASVDEVAVSYVREPAWDEGGDLDQTLKKYKLNNTGEFFWHRYGSKEVKPSRQTDNALREFITETVRGQRERLLAAIDYPTLFADVQKANAEAKNYDDEIDDGMPDDGLRGIFVAGMRREEFRQVMLELIRTDWYGRLRQFMQDRGNR